MANQYTNPWTKEEVILLVKVYPYLYWKELLKVFPNRSYKSLSVEATRLNLKKKEGVVYFYSRTVNKILDKKSCWTAFSLNFQGYGHCSYNNKDVLLIEKGLN